MSMMYVNTQYTIHYITCKYNTHTHTHYCMYTFVSILPGSQSLGPLLGLICSSLHRNSRVSILPLSILYIQIHTFEYK